MFVNKIVRIMRSLRWATIASIIIYLAFIAAILNFAFPLRGDLTNNTDKIKTNHNIGAQLLEMRNNAKKFNNNEPKTVILAANSINEKDILENAFKSANVNLDKYLSVQELGTFINKKINEHIRNSIQMNAVNFAQIDLNPRDGLITWEEYHKFFLLEHGLDETYVREHSELKHIKLNRKAKEEMMRDKARWLEAARTDPYSLTLDEFLAFRHPESSTVNLLSLVDDLLRLFDLDGDDRLTIDEFSDLSIDDVDEKYQKQIVAKTVDKRREEFKKLIDKNNDGKADRAELLNYVDPKHPKYALQEAETLINLTDANKDGQLIFDEMMSNSKIFMSSKMIDTASSFHEEF